MVSSVEKVRGIIVWSFYCVTGVGNLDQEQNKRSRQVIAKLRKQNDEQAKKINILCNDIISAHGDFSRQLDNLAFAVRFYESVLGQSDIGADLTRAAESIRSAVADCNVAVFLVDKGRFELHIVDENKPIDIDTGRLESYFTSEVVDSICRSNKVCSMNDMFEMGLIGNLSELGRICSAAVPLACSGSSLGFILLYRSSEEKLRPEELAKVVAVAPGMCRAIEACASRSARGQTGIQSS